jgi:hypothetical protein
MLSKQRCPHTGIVNFFSKTDPFVSIGSIIEAGARRDEYHWRVYDALCTVSGIAADMAEAEQRIKSQLRRQVPESAR